jgi:NTP pyrophosphatase (non-canonical NTP hydrolase)
MKRAWLLGERSSDETTMIKSKFRYKQTWMKGKTMKMFDDLRAANIARDYEWDPNKKITLSFRGNELAGETGEACNIIKKLERERIGLRGSKATARQLAEELADVVICADLAAMSAGIDLAIAVVNKFNRTSDENGLGVHLTTKHDYVDVKQDAVLRHTNLRLERANVLLSELVNVLKPFALFRLDGHDNSKVVFYSPCDIGMKLKLGDFRYAEQARANVLDYFAEMLNAQHNVNLIDSEGIKGKIKWTYDLLAANIRIDELEKKLVDAELERDDLNTAHKACEFVIKEKKADLTAFFDEIVSLKAQLADKESNLAGLRNSIKLIETKLADKENDLRDLQAENKLLQGKLSDAYVERDTAITNMNDDFADLQAENEALEKLNKEYKAVINRQATELTEAKVKLDQAQEKAKAELKLADGAAKMWAAKHDEIANKVLELQKLTGLPELIKHQCGYCDGKGTNNKGEKCRGCNGKGIVGVYQK